MTMKKEDATVIPTHLGLILDGNRRWAREQGKPATEGHTEGLETLLNISLHAVDRGVKYISVYVFSTENWSRTQDEVSFLMGLVAKGIRKHLSTFDGAGIKLVMVGSRGGVDEKVLAVMMRRRKRRLITLALHSGFALIMADM
jgi:undecaprenyl diphosphate synthase